MVSAEAVQFQVQEFFGHAGGKTPDTEVRPTTAGRPNGMDELVGRPYMGGGKMRNAPENAGHGGPAYNGGPEAYGARFISAHSSGVFRLRRMAGSLTAIRWVCGARISFIGVSPPASSAIVCSATSRDIQTK